MPEGKILLEMELGALRNAMEDKLDKLRVKAIGIEGELVIRELRPAPNNFNIYGRKVFKKGRDAHTIIDPCIKLEWSITVG